MTPEQEEVYDLVRTYLAARAEEHGNPIHVDDEPPLLRARFRGEARDFTTIWYRARERTLHYETYFMPDPEENHEALYHFLMRWNRRLYLAAFVLDRDREVYIEGRLPLAAVTSDEIDRVTGQVYQAVESTFRTAITIGFPRLMSR